MSQTPPQFSLSIGSLLESALGALFIGLILSTALWGVGCAQAYWFYDTFKAESIYLRTLVAIAWVSDTVQQALIAYTVYSFTTAHSTVYFFLDHYNQDLAIQNLFDCLTALFVQSFFVCRIWILSRHNYLATIPPALLVLAKLGLGIAYVLLSQPDSLNSFDSSRILLAIIGMTMASDITIAAFMIYLLAHAKNGFRQSDTLINKLMLFTLNTGLVTSICAVITLILAVQSHTELLWTFYFLTGKLYFNTMLASLNARRKESKNNVLMMSNLAHGPAGSGGLPSFIAAPGINTSAGNTTPISHSKSNLCDTKSIGMRDLQRAQFT